MNVLLRHDGQRSLRTLTPSPVSLTLVVLTPLDVIGFLMPAQASLSLGQLQVLLDAPPLRSLAAVQGCCAPDESQRHHSTILHALRGTQDKHPMSYAPLWLFLAVLLGP